MKARSVTVRSSAVHGIHIFLKQNFDDFDDNKLKGFLGLGSDFCVKLIAKTEKKKKGNNFLFYIHSDVGQWSSLSLSAFKNIDVGVVWINIIIISICFYCSLYYNSFSG